MSFEALLVAEMEERESRAVARLLHEARLPRLKTLDEFEFDRSGVQAARLCELAKGGYIGEAEPVLLVGEAGTGIKPPDPRACTWPPAASGAGCVSRPRAR